MKKLIGKLVMPLTLLSMMVFTKWWYVLVVDGPDEMLYGFPLPFVCRGWHTSLSLQIFIFEFMVDFTVYFAFWVILIFVFNKYVRVIVVPKLITILLVVFSILILAWNALLVCNSDNIFSVKRGFGMEVEETGGKFIWQKQERPSFYKRHPEYDRGEAVAE